MTVRFPLFIVFCSFFLVGCSGNRDKDVNKDKDRPQPAHKK